jgi:hypothetical protein
LSPVLFVLLDKEEILVDVFLRAMLLPQERLAQKIESHGFLERQACKYLVALTIFTQGSYFPEVRTLHVGKYKHPDFLLTATVKVPQCAELITQLLGAACMGSAALESSIQISLTKKHQSGGICCGEWLDQQHSRRWFRLQ